LFGGVHRGEPSSALGKFGHGVFLLYVKWNDPKLGSNREECEGMI
jgi:hypothetical protein